MVTWFAPCVWFTEIASALISNFGTAHRSNHHGQTKVSASLALRVCLLFWSSADPGGDTARVAVARSTHTKSVRLLRPRQTKTAPEGAVSMPSGRDRSLLARDGN